jgi:hypothetical protein
MTTADRHALNDNDIERIWIQAAARVGFRVERTQDAYATSDGGGLVAIGADETLDRDDSVAQLVFHELCHALVQGEENLGRPDWGLDNTSDRDLVAEHACLRLQAHLADAHALRALMTPTTISRAYYVELPANPLAGGDEACRLADRGARWSRTAPWREALDQALGDTAAWVRPRRRWSMSDEVHPLGFALGPPGASCDDCAWRYQGWDGRSRCRQSAGGDGTGHRVDGTFPACAHFQEPLDCRACGACCREGFDSVTVGMREPVVWRQPALVLRQGPHFRLLRAGGCCAALAVDQAAAAGPGRYRCTIYEDRPQACHRVMPGDARCLSARRRVGL